jgi:hypothetical protein
MQFIIRENQIFIPVSTEVDMQKLKSQYRIKKPLGKRFVESVTYCNQSVYETTVDGNTYISHKGLLFDSNYTIIGGIYTLNPLIIRHLRINNFNSQAIFLLNTSKVPDKIVKKFIKECPDYSINLMTTIGYSILTSTKINLNLKGETFREIVNSFLYREYAISTEESDLVLHTNTIEVVNNEDEVVTETEELPFLI